MTLSTCRLELKYSAHERPAWLRRSRMFIGHKDEETLSLQRSAISEIANHSAPQGAKTFCYSYFYKHPAPMELKAYCGGLGSVGVARSGSFDDLLSLAFSFSTMLISS